MFAIPPYTHTHTPSPLFQQALHLLLRSPHKGMGSADPQNSCCSKGSAAELFPFGLAKAYCPSLRFLRDGSGQTPGGSFTADLLHPVPWPISWNSAEAQFLYCSLTRGLRKGGRCMHTKPPSKRLAQLLAKSDGYKPFCSQILPSARSPQRLLKPQTQDSVFCILPRCSRRRLGQCLMLPSPTRLISRGSKQWTMHVSEPWVPTPP